MKKNELEYYSKNVKLKYPWWGKYIDKIIYNYSREQIASMFNYHGLRCLDLGCGDGTLLNIYLYKKYKKTEGVDISKKSISKAKFVAKRNCRFVLSEIEDYVNYILNSKRKYDDVYLLAILEHITWPSLLIKKISKIIGVNGRVIVEVPNVAWLPYRLSMLFGKFPETAPINNVIPGVFDEHIRFYTLDTLDKMFKIAGFNRINIDCSGRLRRVKMIYPTLLSSDFVAVYKKINRGKH